MIRCNSLSGLNVLNGVSYADVVDLLDYMLAPMGFMGVCVKDR